MCELLLLITGGSIVVVLCGVGCMMDGNADPGCCDAVGCNGDLNNGTVGCVVLVCGVVVSCCVVVGCGVVVNCCVVVGCGVIVGCNDVHGSSIGTVGCVVEVCGVVGCWVAVARPADVLGTGRTSSLEKKSLNKNSYHR